jgi:HD superfamily phosphodiesterase
LVACQKGAFLSMPVATVQGALLQDPLPRRWAHVQGVAARARSLAAVLGADADLLEAAAWLHDVGYAPGLDVTGLRALDGARYLRDAHASKYVPPGAGAQAA